MRKMTTKKVAAATDTSRDIWVEIRDESGAVFARTPMRYMSALVFKGTWESAHLDSERSIHIVDE